MIAQLCKRGNFSANLALNPNPGRCGNDNLTGWNYEVKLTINADDLNDQDFVLDHNEVQSYFTVAYQKETIIPSCEMMAMRAIRYFYERMPKKIKKIEVDIIAASVSHKVTWNADEDEAPKIPASRSAVRHLEQLEKAA